MTPTSLSAAAHCRQVDPEPVVQIGAVVGRNQSVSRGGNRSNPSTWTGPAIWPMRRFAGSFNCGRDVAAIDKDDSAPRLQAAGSGSDNLGVPPPERRAEKYFFVVEEHPFGDDGVKFHAGAPPRGFSAPAPGRHAPRLAFGRSDPAFPEKPLDLPRAERQADQQHRQTAVGHSSGRKSASGRDDRRSCKREAARQQCGADIAAR